MGKKRIKNGKKKKIQKNQFNEDHVENHFNEDNVEIDVPIRMIHHVQ